MPLWRFLARGLLVVKSDAIDGLSIDMQLEDVKTVVMTGDVVHLLWLNARSNVNIRVNDSLDINEGITDETAVRAEDTAESRVLPL